MRNMTKRNGRSRTLGIINERCEKLVRTHLHGEDNLGFISIVPTILRWMEWGIRRIIFRYYTSPSVRLALCIKRSLAFAQAVRLGTSRLLDGRAPWRPSCYPELSCRFLHHATVGFMRFLALALVVAAGRRLWRGQRWASRGCTTKSKSSTTTPTTPRSPGRGRQPSFYAVVNVGNEVYFTSEVVYEGAAAANPRLTFQGAELDEEVTIVIFEDDGEELEDYVGRLPFVPRI